MRGEGGGGEGRGGREEEGVRGRNLPPLAASLSAPGLGTKGGTLMNSLLPSPPDARVSLPLATLPLRLSPLSGHTQKCPSASRTAAREMSLGSATRWGRRCSYYHQHLESIIQGIDIHTALFLLDLSISERYGSTNTASSYSWMESFQTSSFGVT
ncbi:Hypothetical predicted protein [Lynx pardinus]|uniref:Uncharacterized protein n=1 Tax=Lynx pardinus TaxID=191816 RepID=A0A485NP29_LYNPA|nr:Hypothetical predicted protein [Lynx pardinus]